MSESEASLRVSDAERDVTLKVLNEHAAVGRLTVDELEERAGRALAAKTRGDLAALTSDLPSEPGATGAMGATGASGGTGGTGASGARKPVRWLIAIMGGSHRHGRFRAVGKISALAIMGGHEIDLREAEIEGGELTLKLFALMGGSNVYVPDSVEVETGGLNLMGFTEVRGDQRGPRPGAPVIHIRGFSLMGGATIYRLPPQARGVSLKQARRLTKAAERAQLPPPT